MIKFIKMKIELSIEEMKLKLVLFKTLNEFLKNPAEFVETLSAQLAALDGSQNAE